MLKLNRPMSIGSPDPILSELAWSVLRPQLEPGLLAYEVAARVHKPKLDVQFTRPGAQAENRLLAGANLHFEGLPSAGQVIFDSLRGVLPSKGKAYPALAVVPAAALLQNADGFARKKGTSDFAKIVEQLYHLGSAGGHTTQSAAYIWYTALSQNEHDPFFQRLQTLVAATPALRDFHIDWSSASPPALDSPPPPLWLQGLATPYTWFNRSWERLCSKSWRDALPRRRWVDWCTCVLRTGIALGYMWEARTYRSLAEVLYYKKDSSELQLQSPLVRWESASLKPSARDITGYLKTTLAVGHAARSYFIELLGESHLEIQSMSELRSLLRPLCEQERLSEVLQADIEESGSNTYEIVRYLLQSRSSQGRDVDYYSLLSTVRPRFLVVDPAPEWIVVVASLAAGKPGATTTLGEVIADLAALGLAPPTSVLVRELERAGLTRSSHDADTALEISSAF